MSAFASSSAELPLLLRVCGGATYHEVFTFKERMFTLADSLRERLMRASIHPSWPAGRFEIAAAEKEIRITHYDHAAWFVRIGRKDVYFQHDDPDAAAIGPLANVAAFVIDTVIDLLRMPSPRTVGAKFDVLMASSRWGDIQANISLSSFLIDDEEQARRHIRYGVGPWEASVTMVQGDEGAALCDLDFFCLDSYVVPGEYVTFFMTAWGHLNEDVLPFVAWPDFDVRFGSR
jgi:hypothetical protein